MKNIEAFLGRKREIKTISSFFNSNLDNAALIYGRRRIGKSELIKHCLSISSIPYIYFECKETSEKNNVNSIAELISEKLTLPPLSFSSFEEILKFLYKTFENKEFIFALDEYPYLKNVIPGLDSIIQSFLDNNKNSKLKLILCGSFVETMKGLFSEKAPLYGRFGLVMHLKAMDYFDSALFYKDFSNEDKVKLYSVFGGVPYYNRFIDKNKTVKENIIDLIASTSARFENEIQLNLKSEISKINNAYEVFETLAKGYVRFSDILSKSKVSSSPSLSDILEKLIKMELVEKIAPINEEHNKRKTGYYICDAMTHFYFKYIFRNLSRFAVMNSNAFFDKYIESDFTENFVPHSFEHICKQFLIKKNLNGALENPFEKIGKYYYDSPKTHTNGEFDIVTFFEDEYTFYEAKFKNTPMDKNAIEEEIKQVNATGLYCKKYGFFSKSGYKNIDAKEMNSVILYTLGDLY